MPIWKNLVEEDTYSLIETFQDGENNRRSEAFIVLCERFRSDLLQKCEIVCNKFGHSHTVAELIAEETFKKYAANPNFLIEKANSNDPDKSFRLYLYGIARRELVNYYRLEQKKVDGKYYDGTEQIITELPNIPKDWMSYEMKVKHNAINSLPHKHKVIYLTYMSHEKKGCNLPRQLQAKLREYLDIDKQATIRVYKKEAIDRVDACVNAIRIGKN